MSPIRSLTALLSVLAVTGCAAGFNDVTSHEHATPYVGSIDAGELHVRDIVVTTAPSSGAGAAPISTPAGTFVPQGYLSFVIVNGGANADTLTGAQVEDGTVTPTDFSATPTVASHRTLAFIDPQVSAPGSLSGPVAGGLAISALTQPLTPGTSVKVTLSFATAGQLTVAVPVVSGPGS